MEKANSTFRSTPKFHLVFTNPELVQSGYTLRDMFIEKYLQAKSALVSEFKLL